MNVSVVMKRGSSAKHFDIDGDSITIGRSSENDIQIRDKFVSRKHLRVRQRGNRFFVKDLGSENGTFINGIQIPLGVNIEVAKTSKIYSNPTLLWGTPCVEHICPSA